VCSRLAFAADQEPVGGSKNKYPRIVTGNSCKIDCALAFWELLLSSKYRIVGNKVGEAEYLEPAESKVPKIGEASQLEASPKLRVRWDVEI